jgi:hypothetical protein
MPYNNEYNQSIAAQLQNLYANHIQHENTANDNVRQNDVMDPLEGMALRKEEVHGGSGTAAATLQDLGYEPMNGATGSGEPQEPKPKRKYARKTMKVAVPSAMDPGPTATAGGVSAGGVSAGGVSGGSHTADRVIGGGVLETVGNIASAVAPFAPLLLAAGKESGGGGGSKRHDIVKRIMKEKGLTLTQASKHVKEHGLYKGGALLSTASIDSMRPNQGPQMYQTGGVPNTKLIPVA